MTAPQSSLGADAGPEGRQHPCRLPAQNYALAVAVIVAVTGAAWWLNARTGAPFGRWTLMAAPGARLPLGFPPWLPGLAVVTLLSARSTARLLRWRQRHSPNHGIWLLLLATTLATLTHTAADLLATRRLGWWQWPSGPGWNGIALWPAAATWIVMAVALTLATPALLDKRPGARQPPHRAWLVWFVSTLLAATGSAGCADDAAVAVLVAPTLVTGVLAFQRARYVASDCAPPVVAE